MLNLLILFWTFFKIGLFTFGGGYAMIPMIIEECERLNYLTGSEIIDFIAISESTPGPFAINMATFVGYSQNGVIGAIFATFGVALPSFIIILLMVNIIDKMKDNRYFKTIIKTVMPIVLGLIFSTVLNITLESLFNIESFTQIEKCSLNITTFLSLFIILLIVCLLHFFKNKRPAPITTIVICAGLGITISFLLL